MQTLQFMEPGQRRRGLKIIAAALALVGPLGTAGATTYYISPTGSDSNNGQNANAPWATCTKVNATLFQPGDQVLFQRGGEWRDSLIPASSGTVSNPIVFDDYGDPALAKPKFWGSDVLANSGFSLVAGTTSTYKLSSTTTINSLFRDHEFLHDATQTTRAPNTYTPNTNYTVARQYVDAHPDSYYYDPVAKAIYLNTGGVDPRSSGALYTGAVRAGADGGAVWAKKNYLTFRDLVGDETAYWDGGYAFRTMNAVGIRFENCEAYNAGKHHFGVINTKEFVGEGLYSAGAMPDLWTGAATALVSYSDTNNGRKGDTSQWLNCTVENYSPNYSAFYTHGGGISDVLVKNLVSRQTGGIAMGPEGTATIRIVGGRVEDGSLTTFGNNCLFDGITLTGAQSYIGLWGNNNVVQNVLVAGAQGQTDIATTGDHAVILDRGQNNTFRFNTIAPDPTLAATTSVFNLYNADASLNPAKNPTPHVYGNIIANTANIFRDNFTGTLTVDWDHNLYGENPVFRFADGTTLTYSQWLALGRDANSLLGDPLFADAADGNYVLLADSPAIDQFTLSPTLAPLTDLTGGPRLVGGLYDMGAYEAVPEPATLSLVALLGLVGLHHGRRRRHF